MPPERWRQIEDIFQAAIEREPALRPAFLEDACRGDEALRGQVEALLQQNSRDGELLSQPIEKVAGEVLAGGPVELHFSTGSMAGPYRIGERLAAGGMGEVYRAQDTRLERTVAIKTLKARFTQRFQREARAISALNHPHICTLYDIGSQDGIAYLVMEYVEGEPLKGPLKIANALRFAIQIASALEAAHRKGILHRDLKPGNILVSQNGVKLLDFGLATFLPTETRPAEATVHAPVTRTGQILGTLAYMSPEQIEGKPADARSDIFSFGLVLYEMVTGRRAFDASSQTGLMAAILKDEPPPLKIDGLPRELERIVTRCLQKDPNRRYQHAGDLKIDLQRVKEELAAGDSAIREETPGRLSVGRWWWLAAAAACVAASFALGLRLHGPQAALPSWSLTRLTSDSGLSGFSALSPDGKLVAYSSDRGLDGEPDLYIKQVAGGQPIRLTSDGAGNTAPDFSPDGSKIVFRSNRDGGGIYEIPAFGGEVRLLARDGLNPKFSPDGSQVAYWVGTEGVAAAVPGSGAVWVVPAAGGHPRRVGPNFTAARAPIWSPDGKHLLCIGYTSAKANESSSFDWWLVATDGDEAAKTGAYDALVHAGLKAGRFDTAAPSIPRPGCWTTANTVIFSTASGDTQNLWEIGISPPTGKVSGAIGRLTAGAGNEVDPSCASGGVLTFTNLENRRDVWSLPFDLDRGTPKGALERITQGSAWREHASLSSNGRYVAFTSDQSGQRNIWMRELATGKEFSVASSSFVQRFPVSNASGARIAFSVYEKDKRAVYVSAPGGAPEKLCEGCLRATGWSRDEKTLLVFGGNPYQIDVLDVASHRQTPLLKHPTYSLLYGRFSADNRWVSFTARIQPNRGRIAIAPVDGPKPVPESAWITIAEGAGDDWANWSPDGKTLYFTSPRDGHSCLWGQRIEARSHHPVGESFAVQHLHGRVSYRQVGWSAAGGRIGLLLIEATGNIWMMSHSGAR